MKRAYIRSTLFNIIFFLASLLFCLLLIPTLLLPRVLYMWVVRFYLKCVTLLEYVILDLRYEVRGQEHLPPDGAYIIAAKHMSQYETFKLHTLFHDPAIILKKELLAIPLWGMFLKKSDVIAIDRSSPNKAKTSIREGALRMKAQERPIVIFPQGTRVAPEDTPKEKPYKAGIFWVHEATKLPVIPLATNSGMFWPKTGWAKSGGTVIFEFGAPLKNNLPKDTFMKTLEDEIETSSLSLMNETRLEAAERESSIGGILALLFTLLLCGGLYAYSWFTTAHTINAQYTMLKKDFGLMGADHTLRISGFPGMMHIKLGAESFSQDSGSLSFDRASASLWPVPFIPAQISVSDIKLQQRGWAAPLSFKSLDAHLSHGIDKIIIHSARLQHDHSVAVLSGSYEIEGSHSAPINMHLALDNHPAFLNTLAEQNIIKKQMALLMGAGLNAFKGEDGLVHVPLSLREGKLFAGPFFITRISE